MLVCRGVEAGGGGHGAEWTLWTRCGLVDDLPDGGVASLLDSSWGGVICSGERLG